MLTFFLFIFIVCLVWDYVQEGGQFILFSRVVEFANSFREQTPRSAKKQNDHIKLEFKQGKRIYAVILPKMKSFEWSEAAVLIDSKWVNKTGEIEHYAGPQKNFYGLPLRLVDINFAYEKVAFKFPDNTIVHADPKELLYSKLRAVQEIYSKKYSEV
jgi:hypothetical protein